MFAFLTRLLEPRSNAAEAAYLLVKEMGIPITESTITKEVEAHPNFPSLLSICEVLPHFKIPAWGTKITAEMLTTMSPFPLIAHIKGKTAGIPYFAVVKKATIEEVFFFDPEKHKWVSEPIADFEKRFTGNILIAEAEENTTPGEKDFKEKHAKEKQQQWLKTAAVLLVPALIVLTGLIAFIQQGAAALLPVLFATFTLLGCVATLLLLYYEHDQYNPALRQICSAGAKVNCGAVLNSKAANILGISWSLVGFGYFAGGLLLLLFTGITNTQTLGLLSWLNILALPYIFFSLYYQWKIVKQWCVLCLTVLAALVLQA
ncbi:MAG: vitamin K epoxide reductase family protein, partial [Niabella sp.]